MLGSLMSSLPRSILRDSRGKVRIPGRMGQSPDSTGGEGGLLAAAGPGKTGPGDPEDMMTV